MVELSGRPTNRRDRRILASEGQRLARTVAGQCFDYSPGGGLVRVTDFRAVRVLEVAFAAMFRKGGGPVVIEITKEAASSFPRESAGFETPPGTKIWLAVGVDQEGRCTYSLRHLEVSGLAPSDAKAFAEAVMLDQLDQETARAGFPIGEPVGRA